MALVSWFKRGEKWDNYACAADTPEMNEKMRRDGFVLSARHVDDLIEEAIRRKYPKGDR